MLFSRKKCAPDKNNKGKRELSGCKSTAFASLLIKSSNGERRSPRLLRSNCDKNVVSKEIAVLGGGVLGRDGKEIPRPEGGSSLLLIWTGSFPRVLSEQIFFASAQVSLRGAASNFDRQDHDARVSPTDNSLPRNSGENDPQDVLVELTLTCRSIADLAMVEYAHSSPENVLNRLCLRETRVSTLQVEFCLAKRFSPREVRRY